LRLVHLADLHLGFRQYQRLAPSGINQREVDVARTFERAVERIIALRPDLVLVAGDVFHTVRPTNTAIVHAFRQFLRLRQALPDAVVVIVAGNHDTPRAVETGGILSLFGELGVHVAATAARRIQIPNHDLEILAVPDVAGDRPSLAPNPVMRFNVLVLHGEVEGVVPRQDWWGERKPMAIPIADLRAESWSYVALGHYHVYRHVAANAYYSGSLEYASSNIWGELNEERAHRIPAKGFVEHDLASGTHVFHTIEPARPVVDLAPIHAHGMTAPELDAAIRDAANACDGGIDGKIVRLRVMDVPRYIARSLDHRALRDCRRRALHFHLDLRRPDVVRAHAPISGGRRASLADLLRDALRSRHLDRDIDREELVGLGLRYLRDAETVETPLLVEQESE
jgi:DNA repair protein SbcD/Mre11